MNMVWRCQTDFQPHFIENSRDDHERHWGSKEREGSPWSSWSSSCGYSFTSTKDIQQSPTPELPPQDGSPFNHLRAPIWSTWRSIVRDYTERKLTMATDKLPGISAIAETFASQLKCDYLTGLWRWYLVYDLMWSASPHIRPEVLKSGSPSWSWAAMNGEVTFVTSNEIYATAEILDCRTTLVSKDAPFGAVTDGELVIRGYLKMVRLDTSKWKLLDESGEIVPGTYIKSDGDYGKWETLPGHGTCLEVRCLTLGNTPLYTDGISRKCHAMVLIESPIRPGCYRRIGFLEADSEKPPFWWEECARVTVTVV
jgi:hypothetical protein